MHWTFYRRKADAPKTTKSKAAKKEEGKKMEVDEVL